MAPKKLSESDKRDILKRYRLPDETTSTIADAYGVSTSTISRILKQNLSEADYDGLIQQKRSGKSRSDFDSGDFTAPVSAASPSPRRRSGHPSESIVVPPRRRRRSTAVALGKDSTQLELSNGEDAISAADEIRAIDPALISGLALELTDLKPKGNVVYREDLDEDELDEDLDEEDLDEDDLDEEDLDEDDLDEDEIEDELDEDDLDEDELDEDELDEDDLDEDELDEDELDEDELDEDELDEDELDEDEIEDELDEDAEEDELEDEEADDEIEDEIVDRPEDEADLEDDDLEDDLDDDDLDDDLDDDGEDDLDDSDLADGSAYPIADYGIHVQSKGRIQILPLARASIPKTCYVVVDRSSELITRPLRDFAELGQIPDEETQERTLPIFDNHRVAKRFLRRMQRVVKVPDGRVLRKVIPYLEAKGITRLLIDGQVYSLSDSGIDF